MEVLPFLIGFHGIFRGYHLDVNHPHAATQCSSDALNYIHVGCFCWNENETIHKMVNNITLFMMVVIFHMVVFFLMWFLNDNVPSKYMNSAKYWSSAWKLPLGLKVYNV